MVLTYIYIGAGGALGALSRYALSGWVHGWSGSGFPWGTLVVNIVGAFALGFAARFLQGIAAAAPLRGLVTIGFLGAFTTFSTFSYETVALLRDGELSLGALYIAGSVLVALAATFLGLGLAGAILRHAS
jgi:CrcB protein